MSQSMFLNSVYDLDQVFIGADTEFPGRSQEVHDKTFLTNNKITLESNKYPDQQYSSKSV